MLYIESSRAENLHFDNIWATNIATIYNCKRTIISSRKALGKMDADLGESTIYSK